MDIKQLTQLAVKYLTDCSQYKGTTDGSFKVLMTVTAAVMTLSYMPYSWALCSL